MKILISVLTLLIFTNSCANSDKTVHQSSNQPKEKKVEQKEKFYESDFGLKTDVIGEPTVLSLFKKCESVFGKGISVINLHSYLREKEKSRVLSKASLPDLTQEELYDLDSQEFHLVYIHRGEKELGIVRWMTINEKSIFIVYSSKNKEAYIEEIHSEDISQDFLKQLFGKGISDEIKIGEDITAKNIDEVLAEKFTKAIRISLWVLQLRYNSDSNK